MADPYAEFGGSVKPQGGAASASGDPYAEFGGSAVTTQPEESHPLDSVMHGIHEWWNQVDPAAAARGISHLAMHPIDAVQGMAAQNGELFNKAKDSYNKGQYAEAVRHGINYALNGIPGLGASIDEAGDKAGRGDYAGAVGQTAGIATSMLAPEAAPAMRAVGRGVQRAAEPIAESALGISSKQRMFSKTPGRAALDDTSGFRPSTVEESAKNKTGELMKGYEQKLANSTVSPSLQPAIDVIEARRKDALAGNNGSAAAELDPMTRHLTEPEQGFAGAIDPANKKISPQQTALQMLKMKQEFGKAHTRWNQMKPNGEMGTARQAYHAMDQELDNAVPEGADMNQRVSSLIPVAERSAQNDLNAGLAQRLIHKGVVHTGAATAGILTGMSHGPAAGLATFVIPEIAASPAVRMAAARGVNSAGKMLGSTAAQRTAQALLLSALAKKKGQQDDDPLDLQSHLGGVQ